MADYNAIGTYNDAMLSEEDKKKVAALGQQYEAAKAMGDTAAADKYHAEAEGIRSGYGYSGGTDGSQYIPLEGADPAKAKSAGYQAAQLPAYVAQEEAVNTKFDAAKEASLAAIETAYQNSRANAEAQKTKIPGIYQTKANELSADAERQNLNFNEYAAASGLNSGAGSQAKLAQSVVNQQNMGALKQSAADAIKDAEFELSRLYTEYQNSIAQAVANNEYDRAAALLAEYQRAAESTVTVAQAQADEGYRAYTAGVNAEQMKLDEEQRAYERQFKDSQAARNISTENADRLAAYGDFSGYAALGYTPEQIAMMEQAWNVANPDIAYYTGRITSDQYNAITASKESKQNTGVMDMKDYTLEGVPKMIYERAVQEYAKTGDPVTAYDFIYRNAKTTEDLAGILVALADNDKTFKEYLQQLDILVS